MQRTRRKRKSRSSLRSSWWTTRSNEVLSVMRRRWPSWSSGWCTSVWPLTSTRQRRCTCSTRQPPSTFSLASIWRRYSHRRCSPQRKNSRTTSWSTSIIWCKALPTLSTPSPISTSSTRFTRFSNWLRSRLLPKSAARKFLILFLRTRPPQKERTSVMRQ